MNLNMMARFAGLALLRFRSGASLRTILWLLALLSPAISSPASATDPEQAAVLELAVAPYLPVQTLVRNYQPLRLYLERHLRQPVVIVTAPGYKTFYERTQRREYPVVVAAAHAAYLAHAEAGYVPMLRPVIDTSPVLVVSRQSSLARARDLRGKTVALPDPLALISMLGVQMLREAGLDPDKDLNLRYMPNHSAAVNHVIAGEVTAAIVSDRALLQMPAATQVSVHVIQTWTNGAAPGVVYLASPALPGQRVAQLTEAILKFTRDTPEGREFVNKSGYGGLVPATARDLEPLAPYGARFKAMMATTAGKETPE